MSDAEPTRDWLVLLIGGSSGVGKTTVAQDLARKFDASVLLADDIRLAIQQATTARQNPALHQFNDPGIWEKSPDVLVEAFVSTSEALQSALEIVIAHHLAVPGVGAIIVEGDNILPGLAAQRKIGDVRHFEGLPIGREMRSVFLVEPDERVLLENMRRRGRGFDTMSVEEQANLAHVSWLYGRWLSEQAMLLGLAVLAPRPWESISQRVEEAIERH